MSASIEMCSTDYLFIEHCAFSPVWRQSQKERVPALREVRSNLINRNNIHRDKHEY